MSSTRSCGSSSTSNSNSTNHMPARRANSSRRTSESSSSQQLVTTTSTTSSSTARQQQHVTDKSAVKRKKRRKDEDEEERVPVVLVTRLEDERKSKECKIKCATEVKVVVERTCDIESIRAPAIVAGKKSTRHPVHRSSENLAGGDAKATEPIRLEVELTKVVAVVVEDAAKALPKKSTETAKSSESKSSKVKSDLKPADRTTERNVHNVNNDNNRKTIDPKITERRLLVKLDRSEVQNYLAAQKRVQRLHDEEKEVVDKSETDKYHSESENQDDDVACKTSTEIKTCAINSDDGEIQNDSVEETPVDDATDRLKEVQKTDATNKVKKIQKPDVTNKVKKVQKTEVTNKVEQVQNTDVTNKVKEVQKREVKYRLKKVQKTDAKDKSKKVQKSDVVMNKVKDVQKPDVVVSEVKDVQKPDVVNEVKDVQKPDITNKVKGDLKTDIVDKVKEIQEADSEIPPVESAVKRLRGRSRKDKNVEEPIESVVRNQRLSSREKGQAKSQDDACKGDKANSDKDLGDNTNIHENSSVQVNKNQTERLDESPKDTSCESAKSSLSSESLNESAVVDSMPVSSEISENDKVSNKIIESNLGSDNDSSVVDAAEPVPLPMEVDEISHEPTFVDDSKAESESAQQICDIHSKNIDEDAETLLEEAETVDKSTEEVLPEPSTENFMEDENSQSPLETLVSSDITECPASSEEFSEENETCESPAKNVQASETSENLVNGEVESPADSFVSCENAESTNEESMNGENNEMIETLEDTESIASTCTLIEETPEELSKELDDTAEELPEDVEKPTEEAAQKEPESIKELPEKEDDAASETSLKTDKLDESFSTEDKANETNEHESTFEYNLKSVENLVIDSILNGEIVSPKMIVPSAASRVQQSFVFEGGVEDFVADIVASKAVRLKPSTPVHEVPSSVESLEPTPVVEAAPVAKTVAPSVHIEEPALVEFSVPSEETLPVEPLPPVEQQEPSAEKETLDSPTATVQTTIEEVSEPAAPTEEPLVDEEFAKHRRKDAISEQENKCEENTDLPEALEESCNDGNANREEDQQPPPPITENSSDINDLQVPSSELVSSDCYPEPTAVGSDNYFESISEADSEICLADRLNQLADLKIPSLEETLPSEKLSDAEDSSPSDHTKRQRILMKITKTDANEHVTHLVESKEEETPISNDQFAADQVTEGEIKIIMRKESSSNNHVIKEIKIIPRTPEGNNSARIPGYSPTSSDLSSGNSSCRVPSCSPAKPDSGSYRMPGWSPASTETGQTSATTTKKKQGRPKKYPIFTDAELIAKTTAIANNGDVHVASKLADKPLFEPVESIRVNEDDDVERDADDEEHQTVITEQTCLSGSQLLDAMPAQPEIAAELTRKIEENQKVKKKKGRPRKYPLPEEVVGTKRENASIARIEFNVIDSIEEFVEPVKQTPSRPVSPVKKRGRPRKYPLESAETSGVEESYSIVESVLIHEVPSDKKARIVNSLMAENAERRARKQFQTMKDLLNKSPDIQPADDVDSQTEDEAPINEPYVERRGRKPRKHLKELKLAADQENSTTENEVASDASLTKPNVERRGRKPWKHLKALNKLSESQVTENSTTENEAASDASPVKAYVERRGRKPWKHLKNLDKSENQITEDADSQTEDEAPAVAPYVERRGRKPWKHLKNLDKSSENLVAVDGDSQTEDETSVTAPYVERRGRKPWKHLKNVDKPLESQIAKQDVSTMENDAVSDASLTKSERRGRKAKHLKNLEKSTENQAAEDADSQTEDETPVTAPYVERRGRKPWKHLKNLEKSTENQVAEDADSQTEDETPVTAPYVERRGRKPWKRLKNLDKSENQVAEEGDSQTEDETPITAPYVERRGRKPWKRLKNRENSTENQVAEEGDSQTEDETPITAPYVERRGRKPWKHLKNLDKSENQVVEDGDSQTEDETPITAPYVERRGRKPWKHLKQANESSENQVEQQKNLESTDASVASLAKVERRGRKPWKHLKDANKSSENEGAEETYSQTEDETIPDNPETEQPVKKRRRRELPKLMESSAAEGATMTEDESADDTPLIETENAVVLSTENGSVDAKPYVERRGRKPNHFKNLDKPTENQADESADSQTEDESPVAASNAERRGRKPSKHLTNLEHSSESQATEQNMSATETDVANDTSPMKIEKRGRPRKLKIVDLPKEKKKRGRPRLYPIVYMKQAAEEKNMPALQGVQNVGEASLINEEESVKGDGAIESVVQEKEAASELTKDDEIAISENIVTEEPVSHKENDIGSDTPLSEVIVKKKRARKQLKDSEDTTVTSVTEEANSMTEEESADEDALTGEQTDKPAVVSNPEKKKRGRPPKNQLEAEVLSSENQATEEASSITDVPAVESIVKKRGRPRKNSQDEAIPEISAVAQDTSPVTEDETVSSTEDIPTSDSFVQKLTKSVLPIKTSRNQVEQPSSQTEDETVSSTEDIPPVEQQQSQPIVKKVKFADLPHTSDSSSTPSGSSVEDSTSTMEPPVVVKKRGRPKIARQADSTNESVDNTTEDETVSSTEDISLGEQHVMKKKQVRPKKNLLLPPLTMETMNNSLAASSAEDLSTFELVAPKKRGRKPHSRPLGGDENSSMAASSMEDLSTVIPPLIVKKKRGRKPRALMPNDSTCSDSIAASSIEDLSRLVQAPMLVKKRGRPPKIPRLPGDMSADSMDEFSPMKHLSAAKRKQLERFAASFGHSIFDSNQQAHDRSPSPMKKRGRPPKYPRENIEVPRRMSIDKIPGDISMPTTEQQPAALEKRKGRLPRRLSQDENFLPSIFANDKLMGRRASYDSGIIPTFSLGDGSETLPSLGKRQGRPPRKFSPDEEHSFAVNHAQMENESPKKLGRPPIRKNDGLPMSHSLINDNDETTSGVPKRRGRRPKKFALEDGFTSSRETSPTKRRGRPPKSLQDLSLQLPHPEPPQDVSLPLVAPCAPCVLSSSNEIKKTPTISTTNLLRQQRKPKMAQPQPIAPAVIVQPVPQTNEPPPPPPSPVKKRGRPKLLPSFDIGTKLQPDELPDGLTIEQLRRRRHSQDDSMFTAAVMPTMLAARPKEFEDAQPRKKRGRPPKLRELPQPFVLQPAKPVEKVPEVAAQVASIEDSPKLKERLSRPRKPSPETTVAPVPEPTTKLTAADFLRTWTDRDDSPAPQTTQQPTKKPGTHQRRFSQDFTLDESSRPSSRNRLRRYSQGDTLDDTSNDVLRFNVRKRLRSSGSDSSIVQDEKRPRVERDLCDQHSITKELVVQLTKIDKGDESPTAPCQQPQQLPLSSDLVRMNLRRKLESNNNSGSEPPPLVPIEPNRLQPPSHSDAKLLMLMHPNEDKSMLQTTGAQSMQPPTQQFCIIFIPDALTSSESSLSKDSQPTATIVNFQPVPDSELANKSVIYTPTTPTKLFVNSSVEEQQRHRSFLCTACTQALDLVGRLEANLGMAEEDKCAFKCPFCSNDFQSVFYLEYHLRQEHLKCENERQCRHPGFNTLRIPSHDASASESEIYITFALKCRSCYELFEGVHSLNEHVRAKHANLIRLHKPPPLASGMICYPPPPPPSSTTSPFKNGARPELLHCPSDCICRVGIRSTDSPMQRAQMLKRCPNFMRRLEKIEAAAYEVYTCTLCKSTFLMKDEVVEHLMKMHEVACKFPCTKCLASFRCVQLQEAHHCSETTIRDLDKLLNIVIMPTDKGHDGSKFEDSSNDELGPMKTTPPPAVPSASTPLNGMKRKNGVVIQRLTRFLTMQAPKKPRLEASVPGTPLTSKKRQKTPCPKCQKKFAYRKSLNDHIIFEHIIPCKADEASKNMAVELLRLLNNGATDKSRIEELATALGKYTDDEGGPSLKKLTSMDEQENWNDTQHDGERDMMQCDKCKVGFRVPNTANLTRRSNPQRSQSPIPQLCDRCDPTRRRRNNAVNNGHKFNKPSVNGDQIRYTYECIQCGESFPTTIELNSHKSREHSTRPNDAALKCDSCSKIFYSSRMLEKHKKLQHDASHDNDDNNSSRAEEDDDSMNCSLNSQSGAMDTSKDSEAALNDTANSSTTSRRDSSDGNNKDEEETCKCPRCDFSAEKVSLKNHLKREHGIMAFICQFCGKLLVEISEVRHMLDYHITSSRKNGGVSATLNCSGDEVSELLRTLGKKRLQSLMIYHDFEGKCNNAIMRCPICPEQFATRESCRHHYQWMHDSTCILCDSSFGGGNLAGQHKVSVHNSIASYVWAIQRLVSAIVHGLRLDRAHPSNVLYQEVSMRLDALEQQELIESEMLAAARASNKSCEENVVVVPEPFLEPVVLSEDQLPGSGNMIEVVIGNDMVVEDSEDNLLENFYLSPNYESSCEQPRILDAGAPIPELEEEEEVVNTIAPIVNTCATIAIPTTPSITTSNGGILIPTTPVTAETYATSAVFKLRQDNGQEEVVLAITDEDLVTYRDDIGSLAEKLSATCDSLSLEEIITMLRSYFENVGTPQTEEVPVEQFAIEPRTQ